MKKQKLRLKNLNVTSFQTNTQTSKGGGKSIGGVTAGNCTIFTDCCSVDLATCGDTCNNCSVGMTDCCPETQRFDSCVVPCIETGL